MIMRFILLSLLFSLSGCSAMIKVNEPIVGVQNEYDAAGQIVGWLNVENTAELYRHLLLKNTFIESSGIRKLQVFDMLRKYTSACIDGAYFSGISVVKELVYVRVDCTTGKYPQAFMFTLEKTAAGYLINDIDNQFVPYAFSEIINVVVGYAELGEQRKDGLAPYISVNSRGEYGHALATGIRPLSYQDRSFVVALALRLEGVDLLAGSELEKSWLDQSTESYGRPALAGAYLMTKKDWQGAAGFFESVIASNSADWSVRLLYAEALFNLHEEKRALFQATHAFLIRPDRPETQFFLAELFAQLGKETEARRVIALLQANYGDLTALDLSELPNIAKLVNTY